MNVLKSKINPKAFVQNVVNRFFNKFSLKQKEKAKRVAFP